MYGIEICLINRKGNRFEGTHYKLVSEIPTIYQLLPGYVVEGILNYWILNPRLDILFVKIIVLLFSKIETESEPIKYGFMNTM